jgi:type VI secretion system secreted protein VgrG
MAIDDMASLRRLAETVFAAHNRPLRLILDGCQSSPLLPQRVVGSEAVCGDTEVRLLCVANSATLALKQFIGVPNCRSSPTAEDCAVSAAS